VTSKKIQWLGMFHVAKKEKWDPCEKGGSQKLRGGLGSGYSRVTSAPISLLCYDLR
jgi:hypothetical protein